MIDSIDLLNKQVYITALSGYKLLHCILFSFLSKPAQLLPGFNQVFIKLGLANDRDFCYCFAIDINDAAA